MSFEDGLNGEPAGEELCVLEGMPVRVSDNAGTYYCAHALWLISTWAKRAEKHVALSTHGEPLVGFLHVPADAETHGGSSSTVRDRFAAHRAVIASALRGYVELSKRSELRVLITGFSQFAGVVDNPTGAFVSNAQEIARALETAVGKRPMHVHGQMPRATAGEVEVAHMVLPVDDRALDDSHEGSLPWALDSFQPHAVLAMGVHRVVDHFRVEVRPSMAGLVVENGAAKHTWHAKHEQHAMLPENRALARAIQVGAQVLGWAPRS